MVISALNMGYSLSIVNSSDFGTLRSRKTLMVRTKYATDEIQYSVDKQYIKTIKMNIHLLVCELFFLLLNKRFSMVCVMDRSCGYVTSGIVLRKE